MNDNHLLFEMHPLAVLLGVHQEDVLSGLREFISAAVEGIVECFGHFEKIVAASDDVPVRGHLQLGKERNKAVQHLRNATAERSGVDHLDGLPLHLIREETQRIDLSAADDACVLIQMPGRRWGRRSEDAGWKIPPIPPVSETAFEQAPTGA